MSSTPEYRNVITEGRLDHLVRGWGICTKRELRELVDFGRVTIDGIVADSGGYSVPAGAVIAIDGVPLQPRSYLTVMMNKPAGTVCVTGDEKYPSVLTLLQGEDAGRALFIIGRLDQDTEGLLLLTNDGSLSTRVARPDHAIAKTYYAEFTRPLRPGSVERMAQGLTTDYGVSYRPAVLEPVTETSAYVTVTEGKYHEVKRLIRACGAYVTKLRRVSIGKLRLDSSLAPGAYRPLTAEELELIFQ